MHSCIEVVRRKHKPCGFRRLNPRPSLCRRHGRVRLSNRGGRGSIGHGVDSATPAIFKRFCSTVTKYSFSGTPYIESISIAAVQFYCAGKLNSRDKYIFMP